MVLASIDASGTESLAFTDDVMADKK